MIQESLFTPMKRTKKLSVDQNNKDDYDINLRTSVNSTKKSSHIISSILPFQKIKSNPSFSVQKSGKKSLQLAKTSVLQSDLNNIKLPTLQRRNTTLNPQISTLSPTKKRFQYSIQPNLSQACLNIYYQKKLQRSLLKNQTTYLMNLYRQHFYQTIQILRFGKQFKVPSPKKVLNLNKKKQGFKTIFLDLDETLIHCDERSNNYTVKLNFPLEKGGTIAAGVRIRYYCKQFLQELSKFAQIIIFTASSSSYADVILDHLDPKKQLISHRLYRHNCTLQKGFYLKDLRISGRPLQHCALVDNSAYCHILQPQNAIPIIPFFHYTKDKQLQSLLEYLKVLVLQDDMRIMLKNTFFYQKYHEDQRDPRKVFLAGYNKMEEILKTYFQNSSTGVGNMWNNKN